MLFTSCAWTLLFAVALGASRVIVSSALCEFHCRQGHEKVPSGKPPVVNGCGGQGSVDLNPLYPAFREICNDHDRCYGRCGASKEACDEKFSQGLMQHCESWRKHSVDAFRTCQELASSYSIGVQTMGCSFYQEAQSHGCSCVRSRST